MFNLLKFRYVLLRIQSLQAAVHPYLHSSDTAAFPMSQSNWATTRNGEWWQPHKVAFKDTLTLVSWHGVDSGWGLGRDWGRVCELRVKRGKFSGAAQILSSSLTSIHLIESMLNCASGAKQMAQVRIKLWEVEAYPDKGINGPLPQGDLQDYTPFAGYRTQSVGLAALAGGI